MNPPAEKVEQIFGAALAEPDPATRQAYLEQACGNDSDLRSRVEALLESHNRAGSFLEPLVLEPDETVASPRSDGPKSEIPFKNVGRYKLIERIGEGGFGAVYLAEQSEPVRRKVALKIIKLGMDTEQVVARFEAERQALAMMDHPSIAKVFDAGATETGRPYFVMELVKGISITKYCDNNRLTVRQRLELFSAVCEAVQHAHQKGIIHRDIKPSNVLVTLLESTLIPKIIDFGVAKATTQRLTTKTFYTGFSEFVGTPEYMSPDQASISGLDVDTRTDIYSLGVLLYELLTGKTPFDARALREASFEEMRRMIREVDPCKPSTRVTLLTEELPAIATRRRLEPAALGRLLRGDLDWIVTKAIDKDRVRRYQTASELADDIERYLNDRPVLAGAPGVTYRISKFIRRNRVVVAAATFVAAAVIVGAALATAGLLQATRANAALEVQAAKSAAISEFLQAMLASVDPSKALGREVSVHYVLDEAAKEITGGALADQPEVEATLRTTLGTTYEALGDYDSAELHLRAAETIRTHELGGDHPETLRSRSALVGLLNNQAKFGQAEDLARQTVDGQERVLGGEHPDTLVTMNRLGVALSSQDKLVEAEELHRQTWGVQRRVLGDEHVDTLRSAVNLGRVLLAQGEHERGEALLRQALKIERRVLGDEHPETMTAMNYLALTLERQGKYGEAEGFYRRSWEVNRRILGPDHPRTQIPLNNLLRVVSTQGKPAERRTLVAERLARLKRTAMRQGADALALHAYAWELVTCEPEDLRDPQAALPFAQQAARLDGDRDANILDTLAVVYQMNEDLESAIAVQEKAVARARAGGPYNVTELESRLRELYLAKGDFLSAAGVSFSGLAAQLGESLYADAVLGGSLAASGEQLIAEGEFAAAEQQLRACMMTRQKALPDGHWLVAETMSLLGEALAGQERFGEAEQLLIDGYTGIRLSPEVPRERKRDAVRRIIKVYEAQDLHERADEWRERLSGPVSRVPPDG